MPPPEGKARALVKIVSEVGHHAHLGQEIARAYAGSYLEVRPNQWLIVTCATIEEVCAVLTIRIDGASADGRFGRVTVDRTESVTGIHHPLQHEWDDLPEKARAA